ncbi:hypothetical protein ACYJ1Y_16670 [Natrialbaceae archaeon A-gly3]
MGVIAADVVSTAMFDNDDCNTGDNYIEYIFDHTPSWGEQYKNSYFSGHFVDVLIEPERDASNRYQATFELEQYVTEGDNEHFNDGGYSWNTAVFEEEYRVGMGFITTNDDEKEELSEEEIEEIGLPDSFVDDGPVYRCPGGAEIERTGE